MPDSVLDAMTNNHSFWQHKYGPYTANGSLPKGEYQVDVLIVGAGFTGLTAAREILRDTPEKKVMVLDANEIGFGASGRNGGFSMTLFGIEPEVTLMRWGKKKTKEAQSYMQQAVAYVHNLIESENLDSDYEHTGMWRVAYSESQENRLKKTYALLTDISKPRSYEFYDQDQVREKLNAPQIRSAIYEPETGILDPCKHVRALKKLAEDAGANIYENTAVIDIQKGKDDCIVKTNQAVIHAKKLILATNAWSHTLAGPKKIRSRQRPAWTYQIVSEPLTKEEWQTLGWQDRMSIEDNRQLVHYLRITKCGRITIGGGNAGYKYGKEMDSWHDTKIWQALEDHFHWLFPTLKHKKVHYKWGGAVSINLDMTPEIGFIGDENIIYSSGCIGHGVSLTQLNGRLIADLISGVDSDISRFWIVNRQAVPMPPGNLLPYLGAKTIMGVLKGVDCFEERKLKK
jgi:glycine/D-amino acid oxidase-like deaminating enzyme